MKGRVGAVDVGGTKAVVGVFDPEGQLLSSERFSVVGDGGPDVTTRRIAGTLRRIADDSGGPLVQVGVSIPGPLRRATGIVHLSPNLGWHDYPLGSRLAEVVGAPVVIDDDANCAALGEAWIGAGQAYRDFVMVIVGSGIGCGVVIGGEVYHGAHDSAGEVGHVMIEREGPPCGCGARGCLETLASGGAIARRGRELVSTGGGAAILAACGDDPAAVNAEAVFDAAESGDEGAREAVLDAAGYLGAGLAIVANAFDPEAIVLGGGLGQRGGAYLEHAVATMRKLALRQNSETLEVVPARLGELSGLYGAARLARDAAGPVSGDRWGAATSGR